MKIGKHTDWGVYTVSRVFFYTYIYIYMEKEEMYNKPRSYLILYYGELRIGRKGREIGAI